MARHPDRDANGEKGQQMTDVKKAEAVVASLEKKRE
jgi:hypothetical protein